MNRLLKHLSATVVVCAVSVHFSVALAAGTNLFGFNGTEIFPIDRHVSLLHVTDLEGDGYVYFQGTDNKLWQCPTKWDELEH